MLYRKTVIGIRRAYGMSIYNDYLNSILTLVETKYILQLNILYPKLACVIGVQLWAYIPIYRWISTKSYNCPNFDDVKPRNMPINRFHASNKQLSEKVPNKIVSLLKLIEAEWRIYASVM